MARAVITEAQTVARWIVDNVPTPLSIDKWEVIAQGVLDAYHSGLFEGYYDPVVYDPTWSKSAACVNHCISVTGYPGEHVRSVLYALEYLAKNGEIPYGQYNPRGAQTTAQILDEHAAPDWWDRVTKSATDVTESATGAIPKTVLGVAAIAAGGLVLYGIGRAAVRAR